MMQKDGPQKSVCEEEEMHAERRWVLEEASVKKKILL